MSANPTHSTNDQCYQDSLTKFCMSYNESINCKFLVQENFKVTQWIRLTTSHTKSECITNWAYLTVRLFLNYYILIFRFLIFYDVGYAQYVDLDDMYLVYEPGKWIKWFCHSNNSKELKKRWFQEKRKYKCALIKKKESQVSPSLKWVLNMVVKGKLRNTFRYAFRNCKRHVNTGFCYKVKKIIDMTKQ